MSKNLDNPKIVRSLTSYMIRYALLQGIAFSTLVAGVGKFLPTVFTTDPMTQNLLFQCLPHIAIQQILVSLTLIMEGLAIGGKQFRYVAVGTAVSTAVGVYQLVNANSVVGIWSTAVNAFIGCRLVNAIVGVVRVHWKMVQGQQRNNPFSSQQQYAA